LRRSKSFRIPCPATAAIEFVLVIGERLVMPSWKLA
jgi:hypothetical protein